MNALIKSSIGLVLLTAIAVYLYIAPGDKSFDAARSQPQDAICKQDGERLARLRARPSLDEGLRFAGEIRCMQLWPQLQTLLDGLSDPSRSTASFKLDPAASDTTSGSDAALSPGATSSATLDEPPASEAMAAASEDGCKQDEERLAALQAKPSLNEALRFEDELKCSKLRPQLLALLDSLSQALPSAEAQSRNGAPSNTTSASEAGPPTAGAPASEATSAASDDACKQDEERMARLRTTPSREEAARFTEELRCEALRPELLALTARLASLSGSASGSEDAGAQMNATNETLPAPQA